MINQVILVGRLVREPELSRTGDGRPVMSIAIAVNRPYKNANGESDADFVMCTFWNKTAENTALYCRKGSLVGVTGRIQTRFYENQEKKRVYVTEVMVDNVRFLERKKEEHLSNSSGNVPF